MNQQEVFDDIDHSLRAISRGRLWLLIIGIAYVVALQFAPWVFPETISSIPGWGLLLAALIFLGVLDVRAEVLRVERRLVGLVLRDG